jgi:hypothetical protein
MGNYLNPGSERFRTSLRSQIYVDKSLLIAAVNRNVRTQQKYMCVSRPRRFGKSMAADMLAAYYGNGEDASALFDNLKIHNETSYREHLNQYDVIKINIQEFLSVTHDIDHMLKALQKRILSELKAAYPNAASEDQLVWAMMDVYAETGRPFIILIDEWDCLFREYANDTDSQKKYLDFLRLWLKDQSYVALTYMTGILPIKKYGSHSALNMFTEYSMTNPGNLAEYFGFTEDEVRVLCDKYRMSFEEAKSWYDGYELINSSIDNDIRYSIYSPKSVVDAMLSHTFDTYWNQTETYEALKIYIQMNLDGLKDAVIKMLAGESVSVDVSGFSNDMTTFHCADDVFTLLIHLGYLSYDRQTRSASIPNKEVSEVYITSIKRMDGWSEVMRSVAASKKLLESLWDMDASAVAEGIDRAHEEISILQYNDENSLSCTINLAFYFAREYYTIVRELPTGKGFADICLIPRKLHANKPAVIIELKKDKDAHGAIDQIKQKNYVKALEDYRGNLLLVGINYDKSKKHSCVIEKAEL